MEVPHSIFKCFYYITLYHTTSLGKPTALFSCLHTDNSVLVCVLKEPRSVSKISGSDYNPWQTFISPQVAVWPRAVDSTFSACCCSSVSCPASRPCGYIITSSGKQLPRWGYFPLPQAGRFPPAQTTCGLLSWVSITPCCRCDWVC